MYSTFVCNINVPSLYMITFYYLEKCNNKQKNNILVFHFFPPGSNTISYNIWNKSVIFVYDDVLSLLGRVTCRVRQGQSHFLKDE